MDEQHSPPDIRMAGTTAIPDEQFRHMIATAAYYRASRRAFRDGDALSDWLEAEAEIIRMYGQPPRPADPAQASARRAFLEKLETELRGFDAKLEELAGKARAAKRTLRAETTKQIEALADKRAAAEQRLKELKERSDAAWEDLKGGADKLWQDLRQTIEHIASRFK